MRTPTPSRYKGFTLLEVLVVVVLLGILGRALSTRFTATDQTKIATSADQLRRDIMHAQAIALNYGLALRLNTSATEYSFTCLTFIANTPCNVLNDTVVDPATGAKFTVKLAGVTLTAVNSLNAAATAVDFDSAGRPMLGSALIATNPARTFYFSAPNITAANVVLRPITGFAEVNY